LEELSTAVNCYLVNHSSSDILMTQLHSLTLRMWILMYYMS